jgi:hypothetical protein
MSYEYVYYQQPYSELSSSNSDQDLLQSLSRMSQPVQQIPVATVVAAQPAIPVVPIAASQPQIQVIYPSAQTSQIQSISQPQQPQSTLQSQSLSQPQQTYQPLQATSASLSEQLQQAMPSMSQTETSQTSQMQMSGATSTTTSSFMEQSNYPMTNTILTSNMPVEVTESESITVLGQTGLWANKMDAMNWSGGVPLQEYKINDDPTPEVVRKQTKQSLVYNQEIAIRYLRPPTPAPPGEIHIRQEKSIVPPPAPPIVIRQQPPRPETPTPLVIREAPPRPPPTIEPKLITVSGKRIPPPPRRVIIERLAPLPPKPQSIIIERWLPYREQKRRVVFTRTQEAEVTYEKPRNLIIQWEQAKVNIVREVKDLGVIRANPTEYISRFGNFLKAPNDLPDFVKEIKPPSGLVLAAHAPMPKFELEGDLHALSMIDLDREGLSEYKSYLHQTTFPTTYSNLTL